MNQLLYISLFAYLFLVGCKPNQNTDQPPEPPISEAKYKTTGSIERLDPAINSLIAEDAVIEILAEGFTWTEGPLWIADGSYLLFSDIPPNSIFKWTEDAGVSLYLKPSGYTGSKERGGEPGSNGLLLDREGHLILCQHGDRKIGKMVTPLEDPQPVFQTVIGEYNGKRFNSPNDGVFDNNWNLYFTDPPYGLEERMEDTLKQLDFQGVFRYSNTEELTLISDKIPRPNGIGLSPDQSKLYVASSEGEPMWTEFSMDESGGVVSEKVFYNSSERDGKGAPDGLKVDKSGNIWATGPGGVWIFNPAGKVLGKIKTGQATSNCAFDDQEQVLYITCDDYLMRIRLRP